MPVLKQNYIIPDSELYQVDSSFEFKSGHDMILVRLNCTDTDKKFIRNFLVGHAFGKKLQNLYFPF